jgi:serine protease AprX
VRSPRLLIAAAAAVSLAAVPGAHALTPTAAGEVSLDRYVLALADGQQASSLEGRLLALGVTSAVAFETIGALAVTAPRSAVDTLLADGTIESARPERRLQLHLAESVKYIGADRALLDAPAKVKTRTGSVVRPSVDGTGSTVAVLDTGIADVHPDLLGQVTTHRNFELAYAAEMLLDAEGLDAFALATGDTARTDDIGHGTHVAGIVAGNGTGAQKRSNANQGVAPGAQLVDLRIAAGPVQGLVDDAGWERNAIAAFDWLLRHADDEEFGKNGIGVNTNSWGLTGTDVVFGAPDFDPLAEIIAEVDKAGMVTVFSAGNDGAGDDVRATTVPNGLPQVISVAASCKPGAKTQGCGDPRANDIAKFSSRGPAVDIAAPGVEIVSAVSPSIVGAIGKGCAPKELGPVPCVLTPGSYGGEGATPADVAVNFALYGSLNGTSMAGPHIAGVVALLLEANPKLTPMQVQTILAGTAKDRQAKGRDIEAGYGLVNVPGALVAATQLKSGAPMAKVFPGFRWKHTR